MRQVPLATPDAVVGVSLPEADEHATANIRHDWKVTHRLSLGMQRPDGTVKRATELIFRKGDFVEVLVFADIVVYPKDGEHTVDIQYAPQEIIRLWTAAGAKVCAPLRLEMKFA